MWKNSEDVWSTGEFGEQSQALRERGEAASWLCRTREREGLSGWLTHKEEGRPCRSGQLLKLLHCGASSPTTPGLLFRINHRLYYDCR